MRQCIINYQDKDVLARLEQFGFKCYPVIASDRVSDPIMAHSDVLYRKVNNDTFIISSCQKANKPVLEAAGYKVVLYDNLSPGYRTECGLNFIINEKYRIYNPDTAIDLTQFNIENGQENILTKQGYTACSTLQVTEDAYITEDENIYNALKKAGIDCLIISKGEVSLPGYEYGFIGGASAKITESEILFFGDFENKSEKQKIIDFTNKYNIKSVFIENKKLIDLGSSVIF